MIAKGERVICARCKGTVLYAVKNVPDDSFLFVDWFVDHNHKILPDHYFAEPYMFCPHCRAMFHSISTSRNETILIEKIGELEEIVDFQIAYKIKNKSAKRQI